MITVRLSNGMLISVPFKGYKETLKRIEEEMASREPKEENKQDK